jgi:hypothetical protein
MEGVRMPFTANDVTNACTGLWNANQADCSAFVQAVANAVGVQIAGDADDIVSLIVTSASWTLCADGIAASDSASGPMLVVGGLTAAEVGNGATHGHVIVVVQPTGDPAFGKYPYAYWGSLNQGKVRTDGGLGTTMNYAFNSTVRDNVHYASIPIG